MTRFAESHRETVTSVKTARTEVGKSKYSQGILERIVKSRRVKIAAREGNHRKIFYYIYILHF
jgi:hypothetical protein